MSLEQEKPFQCKFSVDGKCALGMKTTTVGSITASPEVICEGKKTDIQQCPKWNDYKTATGIV